MPKVLLVFVGAGSGGVLRYALSAALLTLPTRSLPLGTLLVNVSGCFLAGLLPSFWVSLRQPRADDLHALVLVGFLGGYTTFSAFGRETLDLAREAPWSRAAAYVLASLALCLAAVWLGSLLGARLGARPGR
jgi:fluoride exporter